jgi:hypothetical protein
MRGAAVIAVAAALAGAAFADADQAAPAPPLELERLPPGPLPGIQVRGHFRVPGKGKVRFARRLVVTGSGTRRLTLLVTRGTQRELCFAAVAGAHVRRALFTCMRRWDRPPLLLRVGVGGNRKPVDHWMSLIGLVRSEVAQVVVQSQDGGDPLVRPRLRAWRGFPWKAFGTRPAFRHHFPNMVWTVDAAGEVTQDIDLGWAYGPACGQRNPPCTARQRHSGPWSAVRDSLEERQSPFVRRRGGLRAKRIAFDHRVVRQLVAGQPFSLDGVAEWSTCYRTRRIGAVLEIRLVRPVSFAGVVPVQSHDESGRSAYLEGTAQLRIEGALAFHVYVDLDRKRVVGITPAPQPYDPTGHEPPPPKTELTLIGGLKPAGGPGPGSCPENRGTSASCAR